MSRPGQLPPRCPIQKKQTSSPIKDTLYPSSPIESYIGHCNSSAQSSLLEDQPAWLNDLLSEKTDGNLDGVPLRRSASDSVVLMVDIMESLSGLNLIEDEEISASEACGGLESACVYGPNSPRRKNDSAFSNNTIASAFSDYDSQKSRQSLDDTLVGVHCSGFAENACGAMGVTNTGAKATKRNPGQRSRVRKLQYIAELERTVAMLQTVEANLSVKVASLLQQRAVLSVENSQLKQRMAILKQDKLIREGEYQSLKKEAQRLKLGLGSFTGSNKFRASSGSKVTPKAAGSGMDWKMLDMRKLNLN